MNVFGLAKTFKESLFFSQPSENRYVVTNWRLKCLVGKEEEKEKKHLFVLQSE